MLLPLAWKLRGGLYQLFMHSELGLGRARKRVGVLSLGGLGWIGSLSLVNVMQVRGQ